LPIKFQYFLGFGGVPEGQQATGDSILVADITEMIVMTGKNTTLGRLLGADEDSHIIDCLEETGAQRQVCGKSILPGCVSRRIGLPGSPCASKEVSHPGRLGGFQILYRLGIFRPAGDIQAAMAGEAFKVKGVFAGLPQLHLSLPGKPVKRRARRGIRRVKENASRDFTCQVARTG
jgi:hypothetical protein